MLSGSHRQAQRQARIRRILMDQEVVVQNGDSATNHVQDLPPPPPYVNLSLCFVVTFSEFECLHIVM